MEEQGFTLIAVPCWWDGGASSLAAVILERRADLDLFKMLGLPPGVSFADSPPEGYFKNLKYSEIAGFGELMLASFFQRGMDPNGWMMFEKYDGIRALWDPIPRKFFSRQGKILIIRDDFEASMPNLMLDGEIWFGPGQFHETCKISSRSSINKVNWKKFKFAFFTHEDMIFDCPAFEGNFRERYIYLQEKIPQDHKFLQLAPQVTCTGKDHLQEFTKTEGGEGIILRNPKAAYEHGRSKNMVKFKTFRDLEARIISSGNRDGKPYFTCELPNGLRFESGVSEMCDKKLLQPLVVVSCKYNKFYPSGRPREPIIYRPRLDMKWTDVVAQYKETQPRKKSLADTAGPPLEESKRFSPGYWTIKKNRREFLTKMAKDNGLDPLIRDDWYSVSDSMIRKSGGKALLSYFKSYTTAIKDTFPELNLDIDQFSIKKGKQPPKEMGFWMKPENCRELLERFAKEHQFDPLLADNWTNITKAQLSNFGAGSIFARHHKSVEELLIHSYPEVFSTNSFPIREQEKILTAREFFDDYAIKSNFDPLLADNWYSVTYAGIRKAGGRRYMSKYKDCHRSAIAAAYPDANIDVEKFEGYMARQKHSPSGHWKKAEHCRAFFNEFAAAMNFDPLISSNWNNVSFAELAAAKGAVLLENFSRDTKKALSFAYPEIKF